MYACPFRTSARRRVRLSPALALALCSAPLGAQTPPSYAIDVYTIGAVTPTLSNPCFRLTGTIGDAAAGTSANATYTAYAGFWFASPASAVDELFFAGFEEC